MASARDPDGTIPTTPFSVDVAALRMHGMLRERRALDSAQSAVVRIAGREYLNFCSNDYLGLAGDERLAQALADAVRAYGVGAGASPLVCGRSRPHAELEEALAEFLGRDRAVVFSSGYLANLSLISALGLGRGDLILEDRLNHASLVDAGLLSAARLRRYPHGEVTALTRLLAGAGRKKLVLTDSVFSMDGDIAPLPALAAACARRRTMLVVDDAHAFGVLGPEGRGAVAAAGLDQAQVPLVVATLGKAAGCAGAFIAGDETLVESIVQRGRPYIYSTAPPPALAAACLCALGILKAEAWRRQRLQSLVEQFRAAAAGAGIPLLVSETPIQALVLGAAGRAVSVSDALMARGILISAIRPPTVPPGSARLRITLSAAHTPAQVERLVEALASVLAAEPVQA